VYLMAILYQRNQYRTIVLCGNICENLGPPFIPTLHFVQDGDFPAGKLNRRQYGKIYTGRVSGSKMPRIDIPIKRLFQRRPADWARYVQPGCREEWVNTFKTNYTPKKESRLDSVLEINDPSGPYLLNCEPMGYRDKALPARMLRYRSDIWEATLIDGKGTPPIRQVVMFFYMDDDNSLHQPIAPFSAAGPDRQFPHRITDKSVSGTVP